MINLIDFINSLNIFGIILIFAVFIVLFSGIFICIKIIDKKDVKSDFIKAIVFKNKELLDKLISSKTYNKYKYIVLNIIKTKLNNDELIWLAKNSGDKIIAEIACAEIGGHKWDKCKCSYCGALRDEQHDWNGFTCSVCGKKREL